MNLEIDFDIFCSYRIRLIGQASCFGVWSLTILCVSHRGKGIHILFKGMKGWFMSWSSSSFKLSLKRRMLRVLLLSFLFLICLIFFFFLIGNNAFIEKKLNIMFTMVNTLNKEQIQPNQELRGRESKNSKIEIQFIQPQIQAHWNKVPRRRF